MPSTTPIKAQILGNRLEIMKFKQDLASTFAATAGLIDFQRDIQAMIRTQIEPLNVYRVDELKAAIGFKIESPLAKLAEDLRRSLAPHLEHQAQIQDLVAQLRKTVQIQFPLQDLDFVRPTGPLYPTADELRAVVEATPKTLPGGKPAKLPRLDPKFVCELILLVFGFAQVSTWVRSQDLRDTMLDTSIGLLVVLVIFLALEDGDG